MNCYIQSSSALDPKKQQLKPVRYKQKPQRSSWQAAQPQLLVESLGRPLSAATTECLIRAATGVSITGTFRCCIWLWIRVQKCWCKMQPTSITGFLLTEDNTHGQQEPCSSKIVNRVRWMNCSKEQGLGEGGVVGQVEDGYQQQWLHQNVLVPTCLLVSDLHKLKSWLRYKQESMCEVTERKHLPTSLLREALATCRAQWILCPPVRLEALVCFYCT